MGESTQEAIERLLAEGLDQYGMGQVAQAVRLWRQVLSLDPGNTEAREYLETAGDEAGPAEAAPQASPAADHDGTAALLEAGLGCLRDDDAEGALELLETLEKRDPDGLEVHGYIEMVRSRLLKQYRERFGSGQRVPVPRMPAEQMLKFNLPAEAGFLLSLVDGRTSIEDLISVCGMDEFRVLRILSQMLAAGIVELES